jgi:hypothetical protein
MKDQDFMEVEKSPFASLFEISKRPPNRKSAIATEIDVYKKIDPAHISSDPLLWWKVHHQQFPGLGIDICLLFCFLNSFSQVG